MANRLPNVTKNPSVFSDYLPGFNWAAAHLHLPERFPSGKESADCHGNFVGVFAQNGLLETYAHATFTFSHRYHAPPPHPPARFANIVAVDTSASMRLRTFGCISRQSAWFILTRIHFIPAGISTSFGSWHCPVLTSQTLPMHGPTAPLGILEKLAPQPPRPSDASAGSPPPVQSPQRQLKPDRDGPSAAPCPPLTLGHARRSSRPPPPVTDLSVPAMAMLLPAAQWWEPSVGLFLPTDFLWEHYLIT